MRSKLITSPNPGTSSLPFGADGADGVLGVSTVAFGGLDVDDGFVSVFVSGWVVNVASTALGAVTVSCTG
jgi:hypothetical protein